MTASRPNQPRVGYLTVLPASLKKNKLHLNEIIEQLRQDAKKKVENFGLELVGTTRVLVIECAALTMDDPAWRDQFNWGKSLIVFVQVHARDPISGRETDTTPTFTIPLPPETP